jgi:hypothetical protein
VRARLTLATVSLPAIFLQAILTPEVGAAGELAQDLESPCVDSLEQVSALQTASPVYKVVGGKPQFIEDADRPAEIARLQKIIGASCSADPKERSREQYAAYRLHVARSPDCIYESDILSEMRKPDSRDPKDDIERQSKVVAEKCPAVTMRNRWIVLYRGSLDEPPSQGGR